MDGFVSKQTETLCPSAQPEWDGARLFAVAVGTPTHPQVAYLDKAESITPELLQMTHPVSPSEVFRFAAPCAKQKCQHFHDTEQQCKLADKTVRWVSAVVHKLPRCAIRTDCRWWQQEGPPACQRCPQVVTTNYAPSQAMRDAADVELI